MKRNPFIIFLVIEAVLCSFLFLAKEALPGIILTSMAFPLFPISQGLRALSLSGTMGNGIALVLYIWFCLMPAIVLLLIRRKRKVEYEDALLALLSAALFVVMQLMINPRLIGMAVVHETQQYVSQAMLNGFAVSICLGYLVLRFLRHCFSAAIKQLQTYLIILLHIIGVVFVFLAFGATLGGLLDALHALRASNRGNESLLGITNVFLVMQYVVVAVPYVLNVWVVIGAIALLKERNRDRYSAQSVAAARKLTKRCGFVLTLSVVANIGFQFLQLAFLRSLMVVKSTVQLPLLSIAFVVAVLLLTRLMEENKQLKDDNDMFI